MLCGLPYEFLGTLFLSKSASTLNRLMSAFAFVGLFSVRSETGKRSGHVMKHHVYLGMYQDCLAGELFEALFCSLGLFESLPLV